MFPWLLFGAALGCTFAAAAAWWWATTLPPLSGRRAPPPAPTLFHASWDNLGFWILGALSWGTAIVVTPALTYWFWHWPAQRP